MKKTRKAKMALALALATTLLFPLTACEELQMKILGYSLIGLYEIKTSRSYTVRFNANGGEGKMDNFSVKSNKDDGLAWFPRCTFTKEGYECLAWSLDPNGKDFASDIKTTSLHIPLYVINGSTVNFYAVWTTPGFSFEFGTFLFTIARLSDYTGNVEHVIVPAHYDGPTPLKYTSCSVTSANAGLFKDHTEIKSVKNIDFYSFSNDLFYGCTSLETLETHPFGTITEVCDRALYNCSALQELDTQKVRSVGEEAFYMCTSIEKLVFTSNLQSLGDNAFFGWTEDQVIEFTGYSENPFGESPFNGCNATIIWSGTEPADDQTPTA